MSEYYSINPADPCLECGEMIPRGLIVMTGEREIDEYFNESVFCSDHCRDVAIADYHKELDKLEAFAYDWAFAYD